MASVQSNWHMKLEEDKGWLSRKGVGLQCGVAHSEGKALRLFVVVRGSRRVLGV